MADNLTIEAEYINQMSSELDEAVSLLEKQQKEMPLTPSSEYLRQMQETALRVEKLQKKINAIKGNKYRFTILSERLIRMEYNESGVFEDRPSELVWFRDMPKVEYVVKQDNKMLEITTKYFRLTYRKERPFDSGKINQMKNLRVELLNSDKIWYYNHPEVRNYGAPGMSLDDKTKLKLQKGLYSVDGFATIDDSSTNLFSENGSVEKRENTGIDLYLFMYLKDFALCLKDYFAITGSPALIPRYALGNWWSKNEKYNDLSLKELIDNFDDKNIPLSVIMLDNEWHYNSYNDKFVDSGFTWNHEYFKSPANMIKYLHSKGIRLGLNINPLNGIYPYEEKFEQIKMNLQTEDSVIPFNVYDSKLIDVYLNVLIHPLDNIDVDFYWLDEESKEKQKDMFYINHYHFYDMMRNYKRRPMILARNTNVAAHRYPVLYSGKTIVSWDTLKMIPIHNMSATNIGVSFWSHDIGGYYKGVEDNELYTRYVQLGVFSPILKFGSDEGEYYKREPWRWGIKTYQIVKNYLNLRHRLIPYLYAEAYKYHKYGMPLIMPLYYKFPEMYDDDNYKNEYYFGSEFFIAPITKKKEYIMDRVIHRFFLPDGVWYDFVTGKKFPGGKEYISFFKDEDYPVFAKTGAIIPMAVLDEEHLNDTSAPKTLEIHIFPGRSNTYKLYEDDDVLAFLDISQVTKGHALVIPKEHYDTFLSCPDKLMHKVMDVAQRIGQIAIQFLGAKGVNILTNCYEVAGQSVKHFHVHVIPRYESHDGFELEMKSNAEGLNLPVLAETIKNNLK